MTIEQHEQFPFYPNVFKCLLHRRQKASVCGKGFFKTTIHSPNNFQFRAPRVMTSCWLLDDDCNIQWVGIWRPTFHSNMHTHLGVSTKWRLWCLHWCNYNIFLYRLVRQVYTVTSMRASYYQIMPSRCSSVRSDAGCQSRVLEFESQLVQHSFQCLTKINQTSAIRLPPRG